MNESIYLCYKRTLTSSIAASLVFEKLRNNGYAVYYTRKLRQNDFIQHIDTIVEFASDVIVLLDDRSFMALEEGKQRFLESWFARELIEGYKQQKHIVVICLNGYTLPDKSNFPKEIHFLYDCQIRKLDTYKINVSDDIEAFVGELKSKPKLKYLNENSVSFENSSDFLIYSNGDSNVYEYGYLVATLDSNVDKHHPFKYTVNRSGQHCFYAINNDTGQTQELSFDINPGFQKYVYIQWQPSKELISIKEEDIKTETDSSILYNWGKSFFFGNPKHKPDYDKALSCFLRAAELGNQKAVDFILRYDHSLSSIYKVPMDVAGRWYKQAAEYGSPEAWMKMGERKESQSDFAAAIECYTKASELGHEQATPAIERLEKEIAILIQPKQDVFLKDFHNIIENFRRQVGSGRIGKYKREVNFTAVVVKLENMEGLLKDKDPKKKRALSVFTSDLSQLKYHNRMFALLGYLAQKDVFDNLTHKDVLEICMDETGENQSEMKEFRQRMGGDKNLKESNISKMADRIITGRVKATLEQVVNGLI
jgi:tetratricopeptide (TPR) repeat protein